MLLLTTGSENIVIRLSVRLPGRCPMYDRQHLCRVARHISVRIVGISIKPATNISHVSAHC